MKYILITGLVVASFTSGIFYENSRVIGEPDKTVAIMLSKQAIDNSYYQLDENAEYLSLIENQEYEKLTKKIKLNNLLITEIKNEAESICDQLACSEE
jgi:hypothetical protein